MLIFKGIVDDWRQVGHSGNKGFKSLKNSEQVWKYEELLKKKGGIDWQFYWDKILDLLLYPYYKEIQGRHLGKKVWLIEDNTRRHSKAVCQVEEERKAKNILKAPHLSHSPNLSMIEKLWDY